MRNEHEMFMKRCLQLAKLGAGNVAPNPMVGAVLVCNNKIIGEGYHMKYGEAHAEVNCLSSVRAVDADLISKSTMYISLEPCAHFGKTPPCTNLIIQHEIPQVVIGCKDSFTKVNGKGIEILKQNGVKVIVGVLENECVELNKPFFIFHSQYRPYIILKWAQTADNKIACNSNKRLIISNKLANKLVHKWRSEESSILIGTKTATLDNPRLTNRLWYGKNPIRLIIDKDFCLKQSLNQESSTVLFIDRKIKSNSIFPIIYIMLSSPHRAVNKEKIKPMLQDGVNYCPIDFNQDIIPQILKVCYELNIQSILVEGGAKTLQSFIDAGLYDEVRIITNTEMRIGEGLNAPTFSGNKVREFKIMSDLVQIYKN